MLIHEYLPSVFCDLKYASSDNFTGQVIYDFTEPSLRYGTLKKLMAAQEQLQAKGYSLKVWDAYRPTSAQQLLWEIYPDPNFVSNPATGYSGHCRGNTVDVTLVLEDGSPLAMPSEFDDFSALADRDYTDLPEEAARHAQLLEDIMTECGFKPYFQEWWHFSDTTAYPVIET